MRGDEDITEGLLSALRLEKGAQAFYMAASEHVGDPTAVKMFQKLAVVEEKHMQSIYDLYNSFLGDVTPVPLEEFKKTITAKYTESGKTIEAALADVDRQFFVDAKEVLQLALKEEESAKELYQKMAERSDDPGTASLYRELSADETHHIDMIQKALQKSN